MAGFACGGVPKTHYYTMDLPHTASSQRGALGCTITVHRFRADLILMDERILYREGSDEVNFYEYHRWASPPADLATDFFIHRLKDSGAYARVSRHNERAPSDLTLRGQLHRFEEVDRGKEVFASVSLELELIDAKAGASIWRGEAECTRPLASRDLSGVVHGIGGCLEETASKLLSSMQEKVEGVRKRDSSE